MAVPIPVHGASQLEGGAPFQDHLPDAVRHVEQLGYGGAAEEPAAGAVAAPGGDDVKFVESLLRAGIVAMPGSFLGKGGEGFVRLNFGCPRSMLEEALERMKAAL